MCSDKKPILLPCWQEIVAEFHSILLFFICPTMMWSTTPRKLPKSKWWCWFKTHPNSFNFPRPGPYKFLFSHVSTTIFHPFLVTLTIYIYNVKCLLLLIFDINMPILCLQLWNSAECKTVARNWEKCRTNCFIIVFHIIGSGIYLVVSSEA